MRIGHSARGVYVEDPKSDKYRHGVDHVPVVLSSSRTAFLANISIGSPRQPFTVLLDTGSSTLAVFARMPASHGNLQVPSEHHSSWREEATGQRHRGSRGRDSRGRDSRGRDSRGRDSSRRAMRLQVLFVSRLCVCVCVCVCVYVYVCVCGFPWASAML